MLQSFRKILSHVFCCGSKIAINSKNHWNTFLVSNPLPIFVILTLDIRYISCDQSGPEAKGLILVIGGRMGDGTDYNHVGCTLKEHQKVGA
jgi:hypothetical protein